MFWSGLGMALKWSLLRQNGREGVDWTDVGDEHAASWSDRNLLTISKAFQMLEKDSASYS